MSCHDYEGVMSVLCTPLQVKCYQRFKPVVLQRRFLLKFIILMCSFIQVSPLVTSLRARCGLRSALLRKARFPAITASCNNKYEKPEAVFHCRSKSLPIPWGKEQRLGYLQQRCTQWSRWAPRLANLRWGGRKVATSCMAFVCNALACQHLHATRL